MHRRLAASFALLATLMCVVCFGLRSLFLVDVLAEHAAEDLRVDAHQIAVAASLKEASGQPWDESFLAALVTDQQMVRVNLPSGRDVTWTGADYAGPESPDGTEGPEGIWGIADLSDGGYVWVAQDRDSARGLAFRDPWVMLTVLVLLAAAAAAVGVILGRSLSRPFRALAKAAGALGRGRFDLDLPTSRVPEVSAISAALRSSAEQLQGRIVQERTFAEHASHVLRTPLTALRLELDDLAAREGLPSDAREVIERSVTRINTLDDLTGEIVQLARQTPLLSGADVALADLASMLTDRWSRDLAQHDRLLTVVVEGEMGITYTPGPLEHLHELLLVDVLHRSRGDVRLHYIATHEGVLKIQVTAVRGATVRGAERGPGSAYRRAGTVVAALGGRMVGEQFAPGIEITLPRH